MEASRLVGPLSASLMFLSVPSGGWSLAKVQVNTDAWVKSEP